MNTETQDTIAEAITIAGFGGVATTRTAGGAFVVNNGEQSIRLWADDTWVRLTVLDQRGIELGGMVFNGHLANPATIAATIAGITNI